MKVSTADAPRREADILRALGHSPEVDSPGRVTIPIIQDEFHLDGINGCHRCYVTPPAQSSVDAANFCDFFTVETARTLVAQLILAVSYTHARGFVHGDIHLGNALIRLPPALTASLLNNSMKDMPNPKPSLLSVLMKNLFLLMFLRLQPCQRG